MNNNTRQQMPAVAILPGVIAAGMFIAGLFWLAGRWDWISGWSYLGLLLFGETARTLYIRRKNPDLLTRRGKIGPGTKTWDKVLLGIFGFTYLTIAVVAALDERYGWSEMSSWLWPVGAALYVCYAAVVSSAMATNPFFEKTVRIQRELGHRVVDSGPYRLVRHPGYIATILGLVLSTPLLLGSWWAILPAFATTLILVLRTALEDRTLRKELEGYEVYAARVRFRLVPGLW